MGLIATLLRAVPRSEWDGLQLEEPAWEINSTGDRAKFLRTLPMLLPGGSYLYLEGTTEPSVERFLAARTVTNPERIAIGTIWPKPKRYHVPCTAELAEALAQVLDAQASPYLSTHVHACVVGKVLLEWHDAFETDPMRVSRDIDEAAVSAFAMALGKEYTRGGA